MDVVVGRVSGCDSFKGKPGNKTYDARIAGFEHSVRPLVRGLKVTGEGFDHDLRGVEHRAQLRFDALRHLPIAESYQRPALFASRLSVIRVG